MATVATSTKPTPPIPYVNSTAALVLGRLNAYPAHVQNLYTQLAGGFRTARPLAVVAVATATAIPDSTDTQVVFGTIRQDNDGMVSTSSPTQVAIQSSGWYRIALQVRWTANGNGFRACKVMVNGINPYVCSISADLRAAVASAEGDITACEGYAHLPAGSSVFANVWQSSGGSLAYQVNNSGTFMSVEWLAP